MLPLAGSHTANLREPHPRSTRQPEPHHGNTAWGCCRQDSPCPACGLGPPAAVCGRRGEKCRYPGVCFTWPGLFPGQERGGAGEHLLDNFAVCCRNIAACVVDVASDHIVGEVGLQHNVLGVHMHLEETGNRGNGTWSEGCVSLGHQARWWRGRQTERGRRGGGERLRER